MVEFGGDSKDDSDGQAKRCMEMLKKEKNTPNMHCSTTRRRKRCSGRCGKAVSGRRPGCPATPTPGRGGKIRPSRLIRSIRTSAALRDLFNKYGYKPSLYGHFGQGCIHCRVGFDLYTADGIKTFRSFMDEATSLVLTYGGSLSGEHGDGQARGEYLPKMLGDDLVRRSANSRRSGTRLGR